MTGSLSLEDTIATVLARIRDQFGIGEDNTPPTSVEALLLILDEEGPEALVEAVLRAAGVVPAEPATHDGPQRARQMIDDVIKDCAPQSVTGGFRASVVPAESANHDTPTPETLARQFHETYERLAPHHNYETRKESAVAWEDVPVHNKALMVATSAEILRWLAAVGGEAPTDG